MASHHFEITYADGTKETEIDTHCSVEPDFLNGATVTETDIYGNKKITSSSIFGGTSSRIEGYSRNGEIGHSMIMDATGNIIGAAGAIALYLAGSVVYIAGKLVYRALTTKKRQREAEEARLRYIEYRKSYFAEKVEEILVLNNRKLGKYKELFELGVLTEQEYNTYVEEFINLSNQEIEKEKQYLADLINGSATK